MGNKNRVDLNDFKEEYSKITIPSDINTNIESLLNNLPKENKEKRYKSKYKVAMIATLVFFAVTAATLSFEPVRATILSVLSQFKFNVQSYEEINDVVISGNDKIEINEAIFNENGLIFTFTLEKDAFKNPDDINSIEKEISVDLYNGLDISSVSINGDSVNIKDVNGTCMVNEASEKIIGYQRIFLEELKNGDKIKIEAKKRNMDEDFIIELDVNINNEELGSFILKDSIVKSDDNIEIVVEELVVTPTMNYIVYTLEISEELKDNYRLGASLVNEYGRSMYRYSSMSDKEEVISDKKIRYSKYLFNSNSGVEEINIVPLIIGGNKVDKAQRSKAVFVDLDIEKPYVIQYGPYGTITVNSVEETTDKIFLNCDFDGFDIDFLLNNINIAPSEAEEILNNPNIISNFNPIWTESYSELQNLDEVNNYTLAFNKLEDVDEYSIFYREVNMDMEVLDNLAVKIKVK